ncbi:MAG: serine hydrolase, partial [Stackebrandtia sp.]
MNDFADVLADADVEASVHVRDVDGPGEIGLRPDDPAVLASTVKVLVALEFARQVDAGQLDPAERSRVEAADRLGGTGFAGFMDDVETSLRDLAVSMMSVSDNTAADLLVDRVGLDNLKSLAAELGMAGARILGGPRRVLQDIAADLGAPSLAELAATLRRASDAELRRTRAYDPARTTAATPRDMTTLLSRVWRDEAGAPAACAQARALMGRQLKHRVAPAMPE